MIIDIQYIQDNALNADLVSLATSSSTVVNKIIDYVENKVFLVVCRDGFVVTGSTPTIYDFPDDLKQATLHLVESYFLDYGQDGKKKKKRKSVKFDDWSETYAEEKNTAFIPLSFYGIPILTEYYEIIKKYQCEEQMMWGMFSTPDY